MVVVLIYAVLASDVCIDLYRLLMFVCYVHCRDHFFDLLTRTCTIIDLLGFAFALNFNAGIDVSEPWQNIILARSRMERHSFQQNIHIV
mmetsp:Transcript_30642/g.74006  ORF Transcript_30642/g.74006 Transcript_30642/m.74006 type:complete len:89 (+) Transcript_30642:657-923(+)